MRWLRSVVALSLAASLGTFACGGQIRPRAADLLALDGRSGHERWRFHLSDFDVSPPVVSRGVVYVSGHSGLTAFVAGSGRRLWRLPNVSLPAPFPDRVVDNTLVGQDGGSIVAVDATAGRVRWRNSDADFSCPVTSDATGVYARGGDGSLHAVDLSTGQTRWTSYAEANFCAPALAADSTVYVGDTDGAVRALDAGSGELRWTATTGIRAATPIAIVEGAVLIGPLGGSPISGSTVAALDVRTGRERFRIGPVTGVPPFHVTVDRAVFAYRGARDSTVLTAFDPTTGAVTWQETAPVGRLSSGDGLVVSVGADVRAVSEADGSRRWSAPLAYRDARFVVASVGDGGVYVVMGTGSRPNED